MPIKQLFKLWMRLRAIYPDVFVAIRPNGDLELEFKESFHDEATLALVKTEVEAFLSERGYQV